MANKKNRNKLATMMLAANYVVDLCLAGAVFSCYTTSNCEDGYEIHVTSHSDERLYLPILKLTFLNDDRIPLHNVPPVGQVSGGQVMDMIYKARIIEIKQDVEIKI